MNGNEYTGNSGLIWLVCTLTALAVLNFFWKWIVEEGVWLLRDWGGDRLVDFGHWLGESVRAGWTRWGEVLGFDWSPWSEDKIENPSPPPPDEGADHEFVQVAANRWVRADQLEPGQKPYIAPSVNLDEPDRSGQGVVPVNLDEPTQNEHDVIDAEVVDDHGVRVVPYETWVRESTLAGERYSVQVRWLASVYPEVKRSRFSRDRRAVLAENSSAESLDE